MNYDQNIKNGDSRKENVKKYPENCQKLMSLNINWGGHLFLRYDNFFFLQNVSLYLSQPMTDGNRWNPKIAD